MGAAGCATPGGLSAAIVGAIAGSDDKSCLDSAGEVAAAPAGAAKNAVKKAAEGAFEQAGLNFGEAGAAALKFSLGWWLTIPGQDANAYQELLSKVGGYTYDIQLAFLMLSIMLLGGRLALARSGAIRQVSEEGFRQLARATVVAGSIGFFVVLGTRISDGVSTWFIDSTVGDDPAALVEAMVRVGVFTGPGGVALLFVIGIIGILGGLMMAFLLLMRMGMLVVVSAFLPIVASAGGTRIGASAYDRLIAWTVAMLLFKPVGAFVIGIAAMLFAQSAPSQEQDGGAMTAVIGALLLACTALVLPSLMKLLMPESAGGAGGLAVAAAATAAAVKVGGMVATGGGSAAAESAAPAANSMSGSGPDGWAPSTAAGPVPASFGVGPAGGDSGGGGSSSGDGGGGSSSGSPSGGGGSMPSGAGAGDSGAAAAGRATDAASAGPGEPGSAPPMPPTFGSGGGAPSASESTSSPTDRGYEI